MAKKTVKAGMNTSRDGLVDMGTVPGTVKTLVRRMHETANRGIAVGVGDAEGNDATRIRFDERLTGLDVCVFVDAV